MDGHAFDELSRAMARGLPRRQVLVRLGAGGLGAALLGAVGLDRAGTARTAAQAETCRLEIVANVRFGPSAGTIIRGPMPGELRGELRFTLGPDGAIDQGRWRLEDDTEEDGTELAVVGQATGRAITLRVQAEEDLVIVLVGAAEQDLTACRGAVDGLLTGPQAGDLGDWHAIATPLGDPEASATAPPATVSPTATTVTEAETPTPEPETPTPEPETPTPEPNDCPTPGETRCGGACVDLGFDEANCGECGNACGAEQICRQGICRVIRDCAAQGLTDCGGACVDTASDPNHCGECGNACPPGWSCEGLACREPRVDPTVDCAAQGLTDCGGACVDTASDPNHCGGCGQVCASGTCNGGTCVSLNPCPADQTPCGNTCETLAPGAQCP